MPQKNLVIFFLLSFVILIAWISVKSLVWPPAPPPVKLPNNKLWAGLPGQLMTGVPLGVPGIGSALPQVTQVALADWSAGDREAWYTAWLAAKEKLAAMEKPGAEPPKPRPPPVVAKPEKPAVKMPHEVFVLGDDDQFFLRLKITTRGAGIQSVVLPMFQEADRMGNPVKGEELNLIPESDEDTDPAAFLLYHFEKPNPKPDDNKNLPVETLGKLEWQKVSFLKNADEHKLVLKAVPDPEVTVNGLQRKVSITKIYTLKKGDYHVGLELKFELDNASKEPIEFGYQMTGPLRMPIEGEWYTRIYRNAIIGLVDGKGQPASRDLQENSSIAFQGGGRDVDSDYKDGQYIRYAGVVTQFFASMIVVDNEQENLPDKNFIHWARPTLETAKPDPDKLFLSDITTRVNAIANLKAGESVVHKYLLYNGPVKVRLLGQLEGEKEVRPDLIERYETTLHLDQLTDYGRFGFWTKIIVFFTNLMHRLLWILHTYVMPWSFGLCIIMLTVLVRGAAYPLSRKQAIQAAKMQAKMRELAPEFKQLEEKFKTDPMGLQRAKHELMTKRGVNPMAMLGTCWIVLAQMPVFIGLYCALQESILFRLAPFLWMKNLAAPDMLFGWGEHVPFISQMINMGPFGKWGPFLGPFFNIFPIVWVVLQVIQQKMMMLPPTSEQEAMQQKMMKYMMVFVGVWGFKLPAGLVLYFMASALWSVTERKLLPKSTLAPAAPGAAGAASGRGNPPPGPRPPGPRPKLRPRPTNGDGMLQRVKDWWEKILEEAKKK